MHQGRICTTQTLTEGVCLQKTGFLNQSTVSLLETGSKPNHFTLIGNSVIIIWVVQGPQTWNVDIICKTMNLFQFSLEPKWSKAQRKVVWKMII